MALPLLPLITKTGLRLAGKTLARSAMAAGIGWIGYRMIDKGLEVTGTKTNFTRDYCDRCRREIDEKALRAGYKRPQTDDTSSYFVPCSHCGEINKLYKKRSRQFVEQHLSA